MKKTTLFSLLLLAASFVAPMFCMEPFDAAQDRPFDTNQNESTAGATVYCADNESIEIDTETFEALKAVSSTVKDLCESTEEINANIEDMESSNEIYLPDIPKQHFEALLPYLKAVHAINQKPEDFQEEEKNKLQEKLQKESVEQLIYFLMHANYLDIPVLIECCTNALPDKLTQKEELQKFIDNPEYFELIESLPAELTEPIVKEVNTFLKELLPRPYKKLQDHTRYVKNIAFSKDGNYFASASRDGTVHLYRLTAEGIQPITGLQDHTDWVTNIAFSRDGNYFASACKYGTVHLYRLMVEGVQPITGLQDHTYSVSNIAFSKDGNYFASASDDKTVHLYRLTVEGVQPITGLQDHTDYVSNIKIAFSKDGNYFASASFDKTVHLYRLTVEGVQLITGLQDHTDWITDIAFSKDGNYFASASNDGTVHLYRLTVEGVQPITSLQDHTYRVTNIAFSKDGNYFASASFDKTVHLYRLTVECIQPITGLQDHTDYVSNIAFSKDGNYFASASDDQTVHLYRLTAEGIQTITKLQDHTTGVSNIAFSKDGNHFASASRDGTVHLYDLNLLNQFFEENDLIYSLFLLACCKKSLLLDKNHHLREYFRSLPQEIKIILQENGYVQYEQIETSSQHLLSSQMICSSENKPME